MKLTRVLLQVGAIAGLLASSANAQLPEGSTRMVNVDGNSTRVMTLGLEGRADGEPVLFLMAGAGATLESWGEFLLSVSGLAPVVSYDRVGIGESPFDGLAPTPDRVIAHAHGVLSALNAPPPYILVGHSWGGPLSLYYAGRYPDEVVGMVYLDPTDPTLTRFEYLNAANEDEYAERQAALDASLSAMSLPAGVAAEQQALLRFQQTPLLERGLPPDPDVPTSIFLGMLMPSFPPEAPSFMDEAYVEGLIGGRPAKFTARVMGLQHATLIVATDAGHFVHRYDPSLATEAVRRVVAAVRALR